MSYSWGIEGHNSGVSKFSRDDNLLVALNYENLSDGDYLNILCNATADCSDITEDTLGNVDHQNPPLSSSSAFSGPFHFIRTVINRMYFLIDFGTPSQITQDN